MDLHTSGAATVRVGRGRWRWYRPSCPADGGSAAAAATARVGKASCGKARGHGWLMGSSSQPPSLQWRPSPCMLWRCSPPRCGRISMSTVGWHRLQPRRALPASLGLSGVGFWRSASLARSGAVRRKVPTGPTTSGGIASDSSASLSGRICTTDWNDMCGGAGGLFGYMSRHMMKGIERRGGRTHTSWHVMRRGVGMRLRVSERHTHVGGPTSSHYVVIERGRGESHLHIISCCGQWSGAEVSNHMYEGGSMSSQCLS